MATDTTTREMWADRLYRQSVTCKRCSFPLAPHQQQTGLCSVCDGTITRMDATDFEHQCQPMGYRG